MYENLTLNYCAYFQIGKSLLEPASKYKELNGITADEYLEKARTMFEEMDGIWIN